MLVAEEDHEARIQYEKKRALAIPRVRNGQKIFHLPRDDHETTIQHERKGHWPFDECETDKESFL